MPFLPDLFLTAADLPVGMTCVRDARSGGTPPDGGANGASGWCDAGWAMWMAPPDAELYRLDDIRWRFDDPFVADRHFDDRVARAGCVAGPPIPLDLAPGLTGHACRATDGATVCVLRAGTVIAELRAGPGEGVTLPAAVVAGLVHAAAGRIPASSAPPAPPPRRRLVHLGSDSFSLPARRRRRSRASGS